ncbi:MAG TPA: hypothetical protein VF595_10750 [Tepidisphaeraceae bacterium]
MLLVLLLAGLAVGCHPVSRQTVTVIHDVTGQPLAGVTVSPYYDSPLIQPQYDSAVTRSDGTAQLKLGWGRHYYLTFAFPNGERRTVWLASHTGQVFRLWPEPYRNLHVKLPAGFQRLIFIAGLEYSLTGTVASSAAPRFEIDADDFG